MAFEKIRTHIHKFPNKKDMHFNLNVNTCILPGKCWKRTKLVYESTVHCKIEECAV